MISPASGTDIFGGTLAGWQALLTVHGASILAERPLLAVDLTGQHAAGLLTAAARDCQIDSTAYHLPQDLGTRPRLSSPAPTRSPARTWNAWRTRANGAACRSR